MSPAHIRLGVFTATRAEYGLLHPVLARLKESRRIEPLLIVSGAHLSAEHGATVSEIEADGQPIAARVPTLEVGDSDLAVARTMANTLGALAKVFADLRLEAVMLLGDRTELLAAASAAAAMRIPIVHLEGGHLTEGAVDDAMRHAITKLSALHFTAAEPYRARIIQMGEDPDRVFAVGSTGLDNLLAEGRKSRAEVSAGLGLDLEPGYVLATFHPETLSDTPPAQQMAALVEALGRFPHLKILVTLPNADAGNAAIRRAIADWAAAEPDRVFAVESLGRRRYAWALSACEAVVGNSSSGLIEAPAFGVGTVNIGGRQDGRLRGPSILDVPAEADAIAAGLERALDSDFRASIRDQSCVMGDGHAAERIVEVLEATDFTALRRKRFRDLPAG